MVFSRPQLRLLAGTIFTIAADVTIAMPTAAQAACADLVAAFDRAVASRSVEEAGDALGAIADEPMCDAPVVDEYRRRFADFLITYASTPDVKPGDRDKAYLAAAHTLETLKSSGNWQGKEKLADYFMRRGDRLQAHHWYEESVSILTTAGFEATPDERRTLLNKLYAAKSLANDDKEGRASIPFTGSKREIDGSLGGIYSRALLRGATVISVPIPINFYTDQTRFTPNGEKALQEFLQAAARVRTMKLIGHADPRGAAAHNMDLSRRRVEVVRDELAQQLERQGIKPEITIEWKGAKEPFNVSVLPNVDQLSREDIWQLDRRVEWARDAARE